MEKLFSPSVDTNDMRNDSGGLSSCPWPRIIKLTPQTLLPYQNMKNV